MDAELVRVDPPHTFPALTSSSATAPRPSLSSSSKRNNADSLPTQPETAFPLAMPSNPSPDGEAQDQPALSILHSLDLEEIDPTTFRSVSLWTPAGARGAFGGQVIGQALNAATRTVDIAGKDKAGKVWGLHSQHCYFLLPVVSTEPIIYRVEKLRDGRSYVTRQVTATQRGIPVFILSCSFTVPPPISAPQPSFSVPMPLNVPGPEECEAEEDKWERVLKERKDAGREVNGDAKRGLMAYIRERKESPIALKEIPRSARMKFPTIAGEDVKESDERSMQVHERMLWMRTRDETVGGEESNMQKCILAYISDFQFVGSAAQSVGLSHTTSPRLGMLASLDHVVYWYSTTFKTSDWLLHVISAPRTGDGRGVVEGKFYTAEGELIAVTVQEGVVRAAPAQNKAKL